MSQFSVFKNPGRNPEIPFVVQIQSSRLHDALGRVVVALNVRRQGSPPNHRLTPHIMVQGQAVYVNPFDIATLPSRRLSESLGVLDEPEQDKVIGALDELVSRA